MSVVQIKENPFSYNTSGPAMSVALSLAEKSQLAKALCTDTGDTAGTGDTHRRS